MMLLREVWLTLAVGNPLSGITLGDIVGLAFGGIINLGVWWLLGETRLHAWGKGCLTGLHLALLT